MEITFVTGNSRKYGEAVDACGPFGIRVKQVKLEIDEIQSHDPMVISRQKAIDAFEAANKPLVINDSAWTIPALSGFPGGYMKDVAEWFSPGDFIALMSGKADRRICLIETVVYKDINSEKVFTKEYWGEFSDVPKGSGNSIEEVAIFNGKTIAEHHNIGQYAFDHKDYIWNDFAKWFADKKR